MIEPSFSVVIPTCDRPDYLNQALESVLSQTHQPTEIIVVDNGIEPVLPTNLPKDKKIKIIRALPRFGVSQARNLGGILASGDYIAFLDDDDKWDMKYLENVLAKIQKDNPDIVLGRLRCLSTGQLINGKQAEYLDRANLIELILRKNPGTVGSNTTVKRSTFLQFPGYDPWITTNQDKALVLDLLIAGYSPIRAEQAWVEFRHHSNAERQTELRKRIQGKWRFTRKYWSKMDWATRLFNMIQIGRLYFWQLTGRTQ